VGAADKSPAAVAVSNALPDRTDLLIVRAGGGSI